MTPPPANVALMREAGASPPRRASCFTFKFWDAFPDHQSPSAVRGYLLRGGVTRIAFMALRPRFWLSVNMAHQELQASSLLGETAFFLTSGVLPNLTPSHFEFRCSSSKRGRERPIRQLERSRHLLLHHATIQTAKNRDTNRETKGYDVSCSLRKHFFFSS